LPLMAGVQARTIDHPDIIVIQHESIFDLAFLHFRLSRLSKRFYPQKNGFHGILNVDIFGGGSWRSEFSLLTGLSSASFGSNGYQLFQAGRRPVPQEPSTFVGCAWV
jgi:hypothetical protein